MRLKPQTYALTTNCFERRSVFQRTANAELFLQTVARYREQGRFALHGFAIMPDHVHLLLSPAESIEKTAQLVKGGFSFAIRKKYTGEVWQPGYYAHRVTDADDYENQLHYIAKNPERRRLVDYPFVHTAGILRLDPTPDLPGAKAQILSEVGVSGLKPGPISEAEEQAN